jgi:chromosome segregation ATPase
MISHLSHRLADASAELEEERGKVEKGERRMEQVRGMLERGQIGGLDAAERMDGDFGDPNRVEQLERRCENLRAQLREAAKVMVPAEDRAANAVEEATQRAQRILAEVAAQRRAEDEAERVQRARLKAQRAAFQRERRPFAGGAGAAEGWEAVWAQDEADGVIRRGTEGSIVGVR